MGADDDLEHVVRRLRQAWPDVVIYGRGDAGFGMPWMYAVCERLELPYTVKKQWEAAAEDKGNATTTRRALDLLGGGVGADDDRVTLSEEELEAELESQVEAASAATIGPVGGVTSKELFAREQELLDEMTEIAESARGRPDARVRELIGWMRKHQCPGLPDKPGSAANGAEWTDTRVIIFTEYDDTKRYLQQQLSAAIAGTDRAAHRIAIYHGPTPVDKREEIKRAFQAHPSKHAIRILIATDAAREGLNLQAHCWNLFHFDVPWNPSRMEQRNGRINRKLQPKDEVFCHYFYYKQRPENRILATLVRKTKTIREDLGSLSQVIDSRLDKIMAQGIRRDRLDAMEREIDEADLEAEQRRTVEEELEAARERQDALRAQIDRLRTRLEESQKNIGMKEEHFRSAISCALQLMGTDPLQPLGDSSSDGPAKYRFPALDQRKGADPTWADTMDTLRAPKERDQKPWEWRRKSPIRPVVFEDPGDLTDEVVHLHLEQRVVQRLLGRFTALGFVHHDLSRACLAQTTDAIPRVVLLGRLCLYGPAAARLHEELVPVTARWIDPKPTCEFLLDYEEDDEEGYGSSELGGGEGPTTTPHFSTPRSRRRKPYRYRWPDDFRDEVLACLLDLNQKRAAEERLAGLAAGAGSDKTRSSKGRTCGAKGEPGKRAVTKDQLDLPGI